MNGSVYVIFQLYIIPGHFKETRDFFVSYSLFHKGLWPQTTDCLLYFLRIKFFLHI